MTATEYKRTVERAEREESRRSRREEILASKKANQVAAEERKQMQLDGFNEYAVQSKKTQQSTLKNQRSQSERRSVSTQYKLESMRSVRESKMRHDYETDQLQNKKLNAELSTEVMTSGDNGVWGHSTGVCVGGFV
jgi:hypothetical protein